MIGFKLDLTTNTYESVIKHIDKGNDMVITYKPLTDLEKIKLIEFIKSE